MQFHLPSLSDVNEGMVERPYGEYEGHVGRAECEDDRGEEDTSICEDI